MAPTLRSLLFGYGVMAAADLRARLGVSPATLSRLVAAEGSDVLRLGREGRSVRPGKVKLRLRPFGAGHHGAVTDLLRRLRPR